MLNWAEQKIYYIIDLWTKPNKCRYRATGKWAERGICNTVQKFKCNSGCQIYDSLLHATKYVASPTNKRVLQRGYILWYKTYSTHPSQVSCINPWTFFFWGNLFFWTEMIADTNKKKNAWVECVQVQRGQGLSQYWCEEALYMQTS